MSYILVADDNRDYADSLVKLLGMVGYPAVAVYDGKTALDRFRESIPQLVILDIHLPDLTGYEIASTMRLVRGGDSVTIVAITGWQRDYDYTELDRAHFNAHLKKPVPITLLSLYLPPISQPPEHLR